MFSLPPGTTCLVALLSDKELTVANVGDSRGVLCDKDGNAVPLSHDHKPYQLKERKRIKKAGESKNDAVQTFGPSCWCLIVPLNFKIVVRETSNESSLDRRPALLSFIPTSVCLSAQAHIKTLMADNTIWLEKTRYHLQPDSRWVFRGLFGKRISLTGRLPSESVDSWVAECLHLMV